MSVEGARVQVPLPSLVARKMSLTPGAVTSIYHNAGTGGLIVQVALLLYDSSLTMICTGHCGCCFLLMFYLIAFVQVIESKQIGQVNEQVEVSR